MEWAGWLMKDGTGYGHICWSLHLIEAWKMMNDLDRMGTKRIFSLMKNLELVLTV